MKRELLVAGIAISAAGLATTGSLTAHTHHLVCATHRHHHGVCDPAPVAHPSPSTPSPTLSASSVSPSATPTATPTASATSIAPVPTVRPTVSPSAPARAPSPGAVGGGKVLTGTAALQALLSPAFAGTSFGQFSVQNAVFSNGVVTVTYPAGSSAPSAGGPYGGAELGLPFASGPARTATLSYQVRFPVGFQFVQGGKLPGLYGGVEPFSGGAHNGNGWSARLMWRTGGAGEVYAYFANTTGYGDSIDRGAFTWLADGEFHPVVETVHVNDPGTSDGWVRLDYDGKQVIDATGLDITNANVPVDGVFFSTFYGGHGPSWAPTTTQQVQFTAFGS